MAVHVHSVDDRYFHIKGTDSFNMTCGNRSDSFTMTCGKKTDSFTMTCGKKTDSFTMTCEKGTEFHYDVWKGIR